MKFRKEEKQKKYKNFKFDVKKEGAECSLIHELFIKSASSNPEKIAVVVRGTEHYTYGYIDLLSSQLADYLLSLTSCSESIIAVCLEKDISLIITLIAILKTGAAYLPLDPQYAFNRLSYMLEDSRASILITQDSYKEQFGFFSGRILNINEYKFDPQQNLNKEKNHQDIQSDSLAYVIYTSGSTGKPKGIMNTHGSIINCFQYFNKVMPLTSQDVYIQQASISFDTSLEEIFRSLMNCCKIVFTTTDEYYDVEKLSELITKQHATIVQFVPNKLSQFLDQLDEDSCQSLSQVYCGGEPLGADLAENFYKKLKATLYNVYGPSESYYTHVYDVPRKVTPI